MQTGNLVEYIDQQKNICATVLHENNGRLKLLNENNREVSFSFKRLSHISEFYLNTSFERNKIVKQLQDISQKRKKLSKKINVKKIWEILHEESEDIDISTMTFFCFDPPLNSDHEAAVIRAFLNDNFYFKFNNQKFFTPYNKKQVLMRKKQQEEDLRKKDLIKKGLDWINKVLNGNKKELNYDDEIIEILKSYYIFKNESDFFMTAKNIVEKSKLDSADQLFDLFVRAGIWKENENIDLLSMQIPVDFSSEVLSQTKQLQTQKTNWSDDPKRKDMTKKPLITIDSASTLDFDDAISLEKSEDGYLIGIHIIDVDAFIKSGDPIDLSARNRASSIYMPDGKIPMIPFDLSDDFCSLKASKVRPGISTMVKVNRFFEIQEYNIVPSILKVQRKMDYTQANFSNGISDPITTLCKIALFLREKRFKAGAVQITLPEVNVWVDENEDVKYVKIDRENKARVLVSEMMIFANSLMAKFLMDNNMPAVFRSQIQPAQRFFNGLETSIFLNHLQKKQLSRAIIGTNPCSHAGLGVKAYVTATSPIRRYHDLLTQRQIKAILGYNTEYTNAKLEEILQYVSLPYANALTMQSQRRKYWLIKYLESFINKSFEAIILDKYKDYYNVLIKEFMLEAKLYTNSDIIAPGDIVQVTIQHANARKVLLSLSL